jgi:hypothetical protein
MDWYWWLVVWIGVSAVFGVFLGRWLHRVDQRRPSKTETSAAGIRQTKAGRHRKVG